MNRLLPGLISLILMLFSMPSLLAQENGWPRTLPLEQGMMTIYSPQVDKVSGDTIHFRAALAYRETPDSEPIFGAGWFESPVEIDSTNRIVHPGELKVTQTRFPTGTHDMQLELSTALALESPAWNLDFSLDELEQALAMSAAESKAAQNLNTAPPEIIYRDHPALLISLDGDPVLREIENSPYEAVINTPYPLIFDGKHYYLNAAKDVWYRAGKATGPYQFEASPPADIAAMVNPDDTDTNIEQTAENITAANAPEIVVTTQPAELIVTEGPAAFVPLVDDLLVLQNSDDDVFMHVSSQNFYIVLAGRWYHSNSLNGPWSYQAADSLPEAFANIPGDSNQADSRVYVAGTPEAEEAVLDAQVPQTAAVQRGEVDIAVEYDGEPIYQPVDGTDLVYIENTGSTVLLANGLYYLVENGVWYVSSSPNGPWQVSDHRPERVSSILPTSPVYNVKYVHVYDSTPNVVYVGYTPGYTGSYVYHNTIFYGSGWYHRPWISPYYYYPRYATWGFHVGYNSWSGWNFGLSWGWGPFNVSYYSGGYWHRNHYWHHRHYGRWGPRGYRHRPAHYGNRGDRYAYNGNRHGGSGRNDYGRHDGGRNNNGRDNYGRNDHNGYRSDSRERNNNLYRDGSQRARIAKTRDNQPRPPDRQTSNTRQANYASANGLRQKNYKGLKKGESNRVSPVKSTDLRLKADVRDVNARASRGMLLADNSGKVYRPMEQGSNRDKSTGRSKGPAKNTGNRTTQPTRTGKQNPSQNSNRSSKKASGKSGSKQTTQPVNRTSPKQSVARISSGPTRQRSTATSRTPVRQTRPATTGNNQRQRPAPVSKAPVRQTQPVKSGKNTRQRTQPVSGGKSTRQRAPGKVTVTPPRQNSPRVSSAPKGPAKIDRNKTAPARGTAQKSAQKSSNSRSGSKSNSGKRTSNRGSRN